MRMNGYVHICVQRTLPFVNDSDVKDRFDRGTVSFWPAR